MIRFLVSIGLYLAANAIGLVVAALVLDDMSLDVGSFLLAVAIFTGVEVVASPLVTKVAMQSARVLLGATSLVSTLLGLVVTAWLTDGLHIRGFVTWVLATVIVWGAALVAGLILPPLVLKRAVGSRRGAQA